jgi:hypothetical protein
MTELAPELESFGHELHAAVGRIAARRRRMRRQVHVAAAVAATFGAFATVAFASGIAEDLKLDPTKWSVFASGSVDDGRGAYVKAHAVDGSGDSTFMVEHDAALARYDAFLLHEKIVAAAGGDGERGALCSAAELTQGEQAALASLRSGFPVGTPAAATQASVNAALQAEFGGKRCRGLEYAGEQARLVYAGIQPASLLMPDVR